MTKILIVILCVILFSETSAQTKKFDFQVEIDPRIELISIILHYSEWPYHGKFQDTNYGYFERVKKHFDSFKDHEAIEWFNKKGENWNLDDPTTLMLWLSNPPKMEIIQPLPLHPTCQMDTIMFKKTIAIVNKFAEDSDFMKFWKENESFYKSIEKQIIDLHPYNEYFKLLERFYGETKTAYRIVPALMLNNFCSGPQQKTENGIIPHYFTDLQRDKNGHPYLNKESSLSLIFHEFGHSFVNPVCELNRKEIFKYERFFEYIKEDMSAIAYPDWFPTFHEHLVRVGESILMEEAGFPEKAEKNFNENLAKGFVFMPFFKEKMDFYLDNRDKYLSFKDFFPELLTIFDEIKPVEFEKPSSIGIGLNINNNKYIISRVVDNSVAEKSGLRMDDILISINGILLTDKENEQKAFESWRKSLKGEIAIFKIERDKKIISFKIKVPFVKRYKFVRK